MCTSKAFLFIGSIWVLQSMDLKQKRKRENRLRDTDRLDVNTRFSWEMQHLVYLHLHVGMEKELWSHWESTPNTQCHLEFVSKSMNLKWRIRLLFAVASSTDVHQHLPQKLIGGMFRRTPPLHLPFPVSVTLGVRVQLFPFIQRWNNGN